MMIGRRLPDQPWDGPTYRDLGSYWRSPTHPDGWHWWARDPEGQIHSLTRHRVTEHDDGTITVEPSILGDGPNAFHGWLKRGVWTFADDSGQDRPRPARPAFPGRQ